VGTDAIVGKAIAGTVIGICGLLAVAIIAGSGNCSAWFAIPLLCHSSLAVVVAVAIAALPLMTVAVLRSPLVVFLALYVVVVPIDDALLVGQGLTVTKLLGLAIGITALGRLIKRRAQIRVPYAVLGWTAVLSFMALSILWGISPDLSWQTLVTIFSAFALLVILVVVPMDASELRGLIFATIASGALVGVVSIIFARHELSTIEGQVGRLYLTFGSATLDPNRFGASLLLPVAMTVGALGQSRGWRRVVLLASLALTLWAVYLSASRGTMLALIAMAIVAIVASRQRFALGSLLGLSVALLLVIPNEIQSRFFGKDSDLAYGAGRLDIWRVALEIFRGHWLLGTGVGTFIPAYNRAFFMAYEPQYAGWNRDPHSILLSTAAELGLVGIVIVAVALILQYRSARLIGADDPYPWLRTVFRAAFLGLLVASFFVDVLTTKFAWLLYTEMLVFASIAAHPSLRARSGNLR
jgi:putative inorganic carbon (hco3(-)) transporter